MKIQTDIALTIIEARLRVIPIPHPFVGNTVS